MTIIIIKVIIAVTLPNNNQQLQDKVTQIVSSIQTLHTPKDEELSCNIPSYYCYFRTHEEGNRRAEGRREKGKQGGGGERTIHALCRKLWIIL